MKNSIILALFFIMFACKAQDSDTLIYFDQADMDYVTSYYDSIISSNQNNLEDTIVYFNGILSDYSNIQSSCEIALIDTIAHYENMLMLFNETMYDPIVIADTFNLNLLAFGSPIQTRVSKKNNNIWIAIIDSTFRINTWYVDGKTEIMVMETDTAYYGGSVTQVIGTMNIDSSSTKGSLYLRK